MALNRYTILQGIRYNAADTARLTINAPWTPADISTVTWFDAKDTGTITTAGGAVSNWADKSGNGHDASQTVGGNQPTHSLVNEEITFAANDIMKVGDNVVKTDPYYGLQKFAVITVGRWDSSVGNKNAFASWQAMGTGATTYGWALRQRTTLDLTFTMRAGNDSGGTGNTITLGQDFIGVGVKYANNDINSRLDGTITYNTNSASTVDYAGSGDTNCSAICGAYKASNWTSFQDFTLRGAIKELIVIDGATLDDVQKSEGYLAWKWDMVDNLPSDHPYKNSPPTV